mmetsp:Transcript_29915/g.63447  ORF Transcript_29915/g.63447 Transcript_29915/m.63447 type:complete len:217 (+) Transcript_29915:2518-3168(+)
MRVASIKAGHQLMLSTARLHPKQDLFLLSDRMRTNVPSHPFRNRTTTLSNPSSFVSSPSNVASIACSPTPLSPFFSDESKPALVLMVLTPPSCNIPSNPRASTCPNPSNTPDSLTICVTMVEGASNASNTSCMDCCSSSPDTLLLERRVDLASPNRFINSSSNCWNWERRLSKSCLWILLLLFAASFSMSFDFADSSLFTSSPLAVAAAIMDDLCR